MRRKLAAGNWKMHGTTPDLAELLSIASYQPGTDLDVLLCVPATLISKASEAVTGSALMIGGQDIHEAKSGAHTGDVSAHMMADAGATAVIVGHSERRTDHKEDDALVHLKTKAAWEENLLAVVCIGETEAERQSGRTLEILDEQLSQSLPEGATAQNTVVAYEPVWAIGTGKVASTEDIAEVHGFLRRHLEARFGKEGAQMRLLYGGSVKPSNAAEIFAVADVDGALVGGASLKAADFTAIIAALAQA